jgi:plastocyanin
MYYRPRPHTHSPGLRRLVTTLIAICMPVMAAAFFSGSFFQAGTLQPGDALNISGAHVAHAHSLHSIARESETETRTTTPGTSTPGSTTTGTPQTTPTPGGTIVDVSMVRHDGFLPASVTIATGTTVRWTNTDHELHTTTSDTGLWNSGSLNPGQQFMYIFNAPGTFTYACLIHSEMRGTVIVTGPPISPTPGGTDTATPTPASGTVDVSIRTYAFQPQNVTLSPGTTVRWTNADVDPHTTTSDTGLWSSPTLSQGQSFQYTFNTPGTYTYHCDVHHGMTGTITVTGGGGGTPTATAQSTNTPGATGTTQPTNTPQASSTPGSTTVDVSIQAYAFQPQNVTIVQGTTVRWTNNDNAPHTTTSDTGVWNSPTLSQGQSFQFTFNTPGTYTYHCDVHHGMTGTITVTGGGGGTPTATAQSTNTPGATGTGTAQSTPTSQTTPTTWPTGTVQRTATATASATSVPQVVDVHIQSYAYGPSTITVQAGARVRWTNLDNDRHSVTSALSPPLFDSGEFPQNGTWEYVFNAPGTYAYFCTVHGTFMSGTIIVQAASTATATPAPGQRFSDVVPTDYFYVPANWLASRGIISGYGDGTFRPYNNTTRGQLAKIVVLGEGWSLANPAQPTFSDVPADNAFYQYIETAVQHGVISGYGDGTFRPYNNVTRGQLTKIIVLGRNWTLLSPAQPTFSDVPTTDAFYRYVETAVQKGILSGYADNTFRPGNNATRGQVSKILYNALNIAP